MEQNYPQQTVNLTVYGYKGPFVNKPVISIYYNDVLIGDVTQNEIRVFEVAVPGRLMFKYKHLTVYLPITSANGVQVDFDRFSGGLLMQQWLPTVHKENEVFNRKPQKEKKKFDFWGFVKKRKKEIIICLAALAVIIAMFFIADAINNAILTDKVQAYLDGKVFLAGEYVKGESADVYAFEDGCARHEDWMFDKVFESLDAPAVPYKADGSLFSNEVMLKYKNGKNWSYLVYVEICDDGSVDYLYGGWKEITMEELETLRQAALTPTETETVDNNKTEIVSDATYIPGKIYGNIYSSSWLGLKFTLPYYLEFEDQVTHDRSNIRRIEQNPNDYTVQDMTVYYKNDSSSAIIISFTKLPANENNLGKQTRAWKEEIKSAYKDAKKINPNITTYWYSDSEVEFLDDEYMLLSHYVENSGKYTYYYDYFKIHKGFLVHIMFSIPTTKSYIRTDFESLFSAY